MTMKIVERSCFQSSFSSPLENLISSHFQYFQNDLVKNISYFLYVPKRINYLISKTWSGHVALCLVFFFFFGYNTLTMVQGNTAFYILTSVVCYYEIHPEGEHNDKLLHLSAYQCLRAP